MCILHGSRRAKPQCVTERVHSIFMPSMICWSSICPSRDPLRRLLLLFHILPDICPVLHVQCRQRRGLKPLRTRTMRSIGPWRHTVLSQIEKPPTILLMFEKSGLGNAFCFIGSIEEVQFVANEGFFIFPFFARSFFWVFLCDAKNCFLAPTFC